jgi:transcriptional regulator with XRE-family HTH domain
MENNTLSNMADFIATLRKEKGLTQKDLADQLGVTDKAVSKWERGLNCPDITLLTDLAGILGVTPNELLKGERAAAPAPEVDAVVESTLLYADSATTDIRSQGKRWKALAIIALTLLVCGLVYITAQKAVENAAGWAVFPAGLINIIWLIALAGTFAWRKNKLATVILCGFLIYTTTSFYSNLNLDSLQRTIIHTTPPSWPKLFIPHYAVIIALLVLSLGLMVASFLIQKKAVSNDLVVLFVGLGLTILILSPLTVSAIMDYVDLNGLGVNPRYTIMLLATNLMTLLSLAMLVRRQLGLKTAKNKPA